MDNLDNKIRLLSILMRCDSSVIEELIISDIVELFNNVAWINEVPNTDHKEVIEILNDKNEVVRYTFKKNNKLKGKEQITIEYLLKDSTDNTLDFPLILSVLLRPSIEKKNIETGEIEWEQMELDSDMDTLINRANMFKEKLYIGDVYGALVFFSNGGKTSSISTSAPSSILKIRKKVNS